MPTTIRNSVSATGGLIGLLGILGIFLHRGRDLLHRSGGLLKAGRLLLGTLGKVGGAGGYFRGRVRHLAGGGDDGAGRVLQPVHRTVEVVLDLLVSFGEFHETKGEVAFSKLL